MSILQNLAHFSTSVGGGPKFIENVANTLSQRNIHVAPKISSVSGYSSHAIYYVPVWVPDTTPPDTAAMLGKDVEITYSSFIRAVYALNPTLTVPVGEELNLTEYLHRFHQNIMGVDSPLSIRLTETADFQIHKLVHAPILNESVGKMQVINEFGVERVEDNEMQFSRHDGANPNNVKRLAASDLKPFHDNSITYVDVDITVVFEGNQSEPTVFRVPVGIKAQVHPIPVEQLVPYIQTAIDNRGTINQLLRYTTGETMSLMDILFGISQQKYKIANRDKEIMRWANVIDERKRLSKISEATLGKMAFLPNTVVTLSTDEVDLIKRNTGFNLRDSRVANKLIKDYFLLGILISDELTETVKVLYAGFNEFSEVTYKSMSKKADSSDQMVKQIMRSFR